MRRFDDDFFASDEKDAETDKVSILVVDDLPEKLVVYRTILEELGQNLVFARSGDEALKLVLRQEFAVILLDVNMPGLNGFETAALIRQRRRSARTPIIFLTAFSDDVDVAQGYASGAVDYLPTPVMPEILKAKVRVFIELSQMRQQAASQAGERARRMAAEESDKRKDMFLGMLAHELRNPLGPIRNAVHLMQTVATQDSRIVQLQDVIDRQVSHMARLVDDLLDSTRLARGQILLRKERCNLTWLVRQTAEDYASIFEASGIRVDLGLPDVPLFVEGDRTRLVQVIGNLLHNAHKFTDPGGVVSVSLYAEGDQAVVSVRDSGIGIDASVLPHIFDTFQQADQGLDRQRGGLGLGLSLVKGLIELHQGAVAAESDGPGHGASFSISLPLLARETAEEQSEPSGPVAAAAVSGKCKVLIIEDNKDSAETMRILLGMEGYDVETAYTGLDGLRQARNFRPQAILCDIGLPGLDGYQIVRRIRGDAELSGAYVIAMTGYGRDEDQRQAEEAGFDIHMTKPVDIAALRRALAYAALRSADDQKKERITDSRRAG